MFENNFRLAESHRVIWKFTELSQHSENHGVGSLRARLEVTNGPSQQGTIATQFNCEGTTLSGLELELVGSGYRLSLVKRRFVSGRWFSSVYLILFHILLHFYKFGVFFQGNTFVTVILTTDQGMLLLQAVKASYGIWHVPTSPC